MCVCPTTASISESKQAAERQDNCVLYLYSQFRTLRESCNIKLNPVTEREHRVTAVFKEHYRTFSSQNEREQHVFFVFNETAVFMFCIADAHNEDKNFLQVSITSRKSRNFRTSDVLV